MIKFKLGSSQIRYLSNHWASELWFPLLNVKFTRLISYRRGIDKLSLNWKLGKLLTLLIVVPPKRDQVLSFTRNAKFPLKNKTKNIKFKLKTWQVRYHAKKLFWYHPQRDHSIITSLVKRNFNNLSSIS